MTDKRCLDKNLKGCLPTSPKLAFIDEANITLQKLELTKNSQERVEKNAKEREPKNIPFYANSIKIKGELTKTVSGINFTFKEDSELSEIELKAKQETETIDYIWKCNDLKNCTLKINGGTDQRDVEIFLKLFKELHKDILSKGMAGENKYTIYLGVPLIEKHEGTAGMAAINEKSGENNTHILFFPTAKNKQNIYCVRNESTDQGVLRKIILHEISHTLKYKLQHLKERLESNIEKEINNDKVLYLFKIINEDYLSHIVEKEKERIKKEDEKIENKIKEIDNETNQSIKSKIEKELFSIKENLEKIKKESLSYLSNEIFAEVVSYFYLDNLTPLVILEKDSANEKARENRKINKLEPTGWKRLDKLIETLTNESKLYFKTDKPKNKQIFENIEIF